MDITALSDDQLREFHGLARRGLPQSSGYGMRELAAEIIRRREIGEGAAAASPSPFPSGPEITQSIARPRPPGFTPVQSMGGDVVPPVIADTTQPPGGSARPEMPPAPAPAAPNPYEAMISNLLRPSGGGASPVPKIDRIDIKELTSKFPEIPEREKGEVYKSDPYMTMLQTGLRILAAKPEIGRTGLNVISEPLAKGVEQYRGEKEKERTSRQEEAKEARADLYRRQESAKGTAALSLQALGLNQSASYNEAKLAQERAQHGETAALKRLELAVNMQNKQSEDNLRQAQAEYYRSRNPEVILRAVAPFEDRQAQIARELGRSNLTPEQKATLENERERNARSISFLQGTLREETRAGTALDSAQIRGLFSIYQRGVGNPLAQNDPEYQRAVTALRRMGLLPETPDPNASLPR